MPTTAPMEVQTSQPQASLPGMLASSSSTTSSGIIGQTVISTDNLGISVPQPGIVATGGTGLTIGLSTVASDHLTDMLGLPQLNPIDTTGIAGNGQAPDLPGLSSPVVNLPTMPDIPGVTLPGITGQRVAIPGNISGARGDLLNTPDLSPSGIGTPGVPTGVPGFEGHLAGLLGNGASSVAPPTGDVQYDVSGARSRRGGMVEQEEQQQQKQQQQQQQQQAQLILQVVKEIRANMQTPRESWCDVTRKLAGMRVFEWIDGWEGG